MSPPAITWPRADDFITAGTVGYVMPKERSLDIDTELDLKIADFLLNPRAALSMDKYPRHVSVDLSKYKADVNDPETFYGLPQNVEFCESCVISNQRPNSAVEFAHTKDSKKATIHFDEHGVCDACRVAEEKHNTIDWDEREPQAAGAVRPAIAAMTDTMTAWCRVPAARTASMPSHVLKHKYGMHPLTVHLGAAHLHRMGLEEFPVLDPRRASTISCTRRTDARTGC